MEQSAFVKRRPGRIVDGQGAGGQQLIRRLAADVPGGNQPGTRGLPPHFEKMRLAAPRAAGQHHAIVGPFRVTVDHRHGARVGRRDEEILAAQRRALRKVKHQLAAGTARHATGRSGGRD